MAKKTSAKSKTPVKKKTKVIKGPIQPYEIIMGVTQSILSDWKACRVRSRLSLDGWELKQDKASLRFGSFIHDILEKLYGIVQEEYESREEQFVHMEALVAQMCEAHVEKHTNKPGSLANVDDLEMEAAVASALLPEKYFAAWPEDLKRNWIKIESKFDETWIGTEDLQINWRLRGRQDACFAEKGGLYLLETKTRSQIREAEVSQYLNFDFQSLFYILALEQWIERTTPKGKQRPKVKGAIYNILRKPGLRRKESETHKQFMDRTRADVEKRPDHYFHRTAIVFPDAVKAEFRSQLQDELVEFNAWLDGKLPTYRNENSCFGKYNCAFLDYCSSGSFAGFARTKKPFSELED